MEIEGPQNYSQITSSEKFFQQPRCPKATWLGNCPAVAHKILSNMDSRMAQRRKIIPKPFPTFNWEHKMQASSFSVLWGANDQVTLTSIDDIELERLLVSKTSSNLNLPSVVHLPQLPFYKLNFVDWARSVFSRRTSYLLLFTAVIFTAILLKKLNFPCPPPNNSHFFPPEYI